MLCILLGLLKLTPFFSPADLRITLLFIVQLLKLVISPPFCVWNILFDMLDVTCIEGLM